MIDRRSFLTSLGGVPFASVAVSGGTVRKGRETESISHWDTLDVEEKKLRMAERVVPGTDPEQLVLTDPDLTASTELYETYQDTAAGTPFVTSVTEEVPSLSSADMAVRAYVLTGNGHSKPERSRYVDSVSIALPAGTTEECIAATIGWEDRARARAERQKSDASSGESHEITHDRGLTRIQTTTESEAYRLQRLRLLEDRLLVTWTEGRYHGESAWQSLVEATQIEAEALLRPVRVFLSEGGSIPAHLPRLEPARRWW